MSEIIELQLSAMAHGGSALGRHSGRVIFVPYTIPGERVRVEIVKAHTRWARARLLEVLEPSPHRVEPPCPHFGPGKCGGCHLQHIAYEMQAELKQQVMIDQLARLGDLHEINVQDTIGAAEPWGYRNHAAFSLTPEGTLGFLTAESPDEVLEVIPVKECLILDPLLDDLWAALDMEWPQLYRLSLRCGSATGDLLAVFELDHYEDFDIEVDFPVSCTLLLTDGEVVVLMGNPYLLEHVAGREYQVSAGSSFPANTSGTEALVALVQEYLDPKGSETLVDVYCGVGLFGLALADHAFHVIGIDADPGAIADFRYNAQGLEHIVPIEGKAQAALSGLEDPVDLMVIEPPRSGAGKQIVGEIVRLRPRRLAYVSCDPATLARDARHLVDSGYHLQVVQPLDLLPQSFHITSVALFARDGSL